MSSQPWYHAGLRFQCTGCGDCCTGAPGFVWVNKAEIEALAAAVGMGVELFERLHVRLVGIRKSLVERPNYDCVCFDSKARRCMVYHARPRQCRTWPFWDSNLHSPENWERTCSACPGCGSGALVPLEEMQRQIGRLKV